MLHLELLVSNMSELEPRAPPLSASHISLLRRMERHLNDTRL